MAETLIYATVILVPLLAFGCARGAKGLGQKFALARLTVVDSVAETIDSQMSAFGRAGGTAIVLIVIALGLLILVPATGISWAPFVGTAIGFGANIALGYSAGVGGNVAGILAKPGVRDTIDCQMEMKRRLRRLLKQFLKARPLVLLVLFAMAGPLCASDGVWPWAIDITDSMDAAQREAAIEKLIDAAPERAHRLGAGWIQVVKFDQAGMLSDVTWVQVPAEVLYADCKKAKPASVVMEGFIGFSPSLAEGWKQKAIDDCLAGQRVQRHAQAEQERGLREKLRDATRAVPKREVTTRIVPVIEWLVGDPRAVAIDVVTDGIDRSGVPINNLRIPKRVGVTMIITRPNPRRVSPSLDDVLSAAKAWAQVSGITVVGVGDYAYVTTRASM